MAGDGGVNSAFAHDARSGLVFLEDGVGAKGKYLAVSNCADQLEANGITAFAANGKFAASQQSAGMHEPVGIMMHAVDSALRNRLAWFEEFGSHPALLGSVQLRA